MATRREIVRARARARCEYCRLPEALSGAVFHVEHIIPRSKGGADSESNRALACPRCNERKGALRDYRDPRSRKIVPLFHPRRHSWTAHFRRSSDHRMILGLTPTGRATVEALGLNSLSRQALRVIWHDRLSDLLPFD